MSALHFCGTLSSDSLNLVTWCLCGKNSFIMHKAIGIFDSGIGGLTVLKEIVAKLPRENIIYLGDTARVPYGIRSPETVTRYSFENTNFLLSQEIKMLVIACNTASAISLEAVKKEYPLPVIGVLERKSVV